MTVRRILIMVNGGGDDGVAGDNIPGVGGNDYPVKSQADLCALNPTNPGC